MCGPTEELYLRERQVAIGVVHKLEMFLQLFSNKGNGRER